MTTSYEDIWPKEEYKAKVHDNRVEEITIHDPSVPDGISISRQQVRELFCAKATDPEIQLFLMLCKSQNLNPFKREAYLIKYDQSKPATMVVGKEVFTKRAMNHPRFRGFKNGLILERKGEVIYDQGCFSLDTDRLLGGWVEVYLDGLVVPMFESVKLEEAEAQSFFWKKMANTMIAKVALVRGLRNAFPDALGGLYDASEIPETAGVVSLADGKPIAEIEGRTKADAEAIAEVEEGRRGIKELYPLLLEESRKVTGLSEYKIPVDEVDDGIFPCPEHAGELLRKRPGKFGEFWSHKTDDPDVILYPKGYCTLSVKLIRRTMGKVSAALGWDKNNQINFEAEHIGGGINDLFNDPSGMIRFLKALTDKAKEQEEESYQAELDEVRQAEIDDVKKGLKDLGV